MDSYHQLASVQRQRVSDGNTVPLLAGCEGRRTLVIIWPQLGDFDSLEYAWWLQREQAKLSAADVTVRAVGIGDRGSGQQFCHYTGFSPEALFVDPTAEIHQALELYSGLTWTIPGLSPQQQAWVNLMLMCAGIASPGTLAEVLRGYTGDRSAPQLIPDEETIENTPLPPMKGTFFRWAGGKGFQRPFELATRRLQNMTEVLSHWKTYVPDARYMTQRGGTFLFDETGTLLYEYRDRGILGFSATMNYPLAFLDTVLAEDRGGQGAVAP